MAKNLKPWYWAAATLAGSVFLDRGVVNDLLGYFLPAYKTIPPTIRQNGLEIAVNSIMSYFTIKSSFKNWFQTLPPKRKAKIAAAAFGVMLALPSETNYLKNKTLKGQFLDGAYTLWTKVTCFEIGKSLDRLVDEQGVHHKEAVKGKRYPVDLRILVAIESAESAGISCAVSSAYARGPMQLMDGTAKDYGVKNPFNVKENIRGGDEFFIDMISKYGGNTRLALAAYNFGPKNVDEAIKKAKSRDYSKIERYLPMETRVFVPTVMKKYDFLKRGHNENLEKRKHIPQIRKKAHVANPEFKIDHMPSYMAHHRMS